MSSEAFILLKQMKKKPDNVDLLQCHNLKNLLEKEGTSNLAEEIKQEYKDDASQIEFINKAIKIFENEKNRIDQEAADKERKAHQQSISPLPSPRGLSQSSSIVGVTPSTSGQGSVDSIQPRSSSAISRVNAWFFSSKNGDSAQPADAAQEEIKKQNLGELPFQNTHRNDIEHIINELVAIKNYLLKVQEDKKFSM